jgi:hypothetical protein
MTCELLKTEQNGIEFYTIASSGESGISQSGLAILCGASHTTIGRLEKTLVRSEAPELLKAFMDERLTLVRGEDDAFINGEVAGNLRIYRAEFCIAVIKHYADKGKKEAVYSLMKFAEMGFNAWIQSVTGWRSPSDLAELKSDISELKAMVQTLIEARSLPAAPKPLFSEAEIRRQNKREIYWASIPGTASYESCEFIKQLFEGQGQAESGSGMDSMGDLLGNFNPKPKPAPKPKGKQQGGSR